MLPGGRRSAAAGPDRFARGWRRVTCAMGLCFAGDLNRRREAYLPSGATARASSRAARQAHERFSVKEITNIALVGLGGAIGSMLRYAMGLLLGMVIAGSAGARLPWATLAVNVIGCAAAGFLVARSLPQGVGLSTALVGQGGTLAGAIPHSTRLFVLVGILGGFTTFSAFGLETVDLARRGEIGLLLWNVALNLVLGVGAVWGGLWLGIWMNAWMGSRGGSVTGV